MAVRTTIASAMAAAWLVAVPAGAQTGSAKPTRLTIGVSGGVQQAAEDGSDHFSFPKNAETETIDVKYPMKTLGLVDLAASYRVWKNVGCRRRRFRHEWEGRGGRDRERAASVLFQPAAHRHRNR